MTQILKTQDLEAVFIPDATRPRVISLVYDQQEVYRIEDGVDVHTVYLPANYLPNVMQQFWDDELVLELFPKLKLLTVNRLPGLRELQFGAYATCQ